MKSKIDNASFPLLPVCGGYDVLIYDAYAQAVSNPAKTELGV
jgi:hypothetical protein